MLHTYSLLATRYSLLAARCSLLTAHYSLLTTHYRFADYHERTLYNAVLGTQRGTLPGEMLYMMPMGSGVSKAGIRNAQQGRKYKV